MGDSFDGSRGSGQSFSSPSPSIVSKALQTAVVGSTVIANLIGNIPVCLTILLTCDLRISVRCHNHLPLWLARVILLLSVSRYQGKDSSDRLEIRYLETNCWNNCLVDIVNNLRMIVNKNQTKSEIRDQKMWKSKFAQIPALLVVHIILSIALWFISQICFCFCGKWRY